MSAKTSPGVAADGALEEAVVRRGTVIWGGGPFDRIKGGQQPQPVRSGPGEKVKLPRETVTRLRARGVLHDPQTPEIPIALGPNFNLEDGVQVAATEPQAEAEAA